MSIVGRAFEELLGRLELNPTRSARASQRYNSVKSVVERSLPDATVRQIGSFQRRTKIRPVDFSDQLDVDALVVVGDAFAVRDGGVATDSALDSVLTVLRRSGIYGEMDPKTDAPVIVLDYADSFRMELAAGYRDLTGARSRAGTPCYLVPGPNGVWLPADYDHDAMVIQQLNQDPRVGGALVPTIKVLKHLIRANRIPVKSFHLEILAALILPSAAAQWAQSGVTWGIEHAVAHILCYAGDHLNGPVVLPGSYSVPVEADLSPAWRGHVARFLLQLGQKMWALSNTTDERRAIQGLRELIGDPFPALSALGQALEARK